jgi:hypothetical protein
LYAEEESPLNWASEISYEGRYFNDDGVENTVDYNNAALMRIKMDFEVDDWEGRFSVFGRFDANDEDRNLGTIEDAWIGFEGETFTLRAGWMIFNWSATEAFHPADSVNSKNLDSNLDNLEKLGEPTISISHNVFENGQVSYFYFPYYVKPKYPGPDSRYGFGGTLLEPTFVESDGLVSANNFGAQYGILYEDQVLDGDLGLHVLNHMDRETTLFAIVNFNPELRPLYYRAWQFGGTYQRPFDDIMFKLETVFKKFIETPSVLVPSLPSDPRFQTPVDHGITAFGLEKTIDYDGNGWETTFLFEGQFVTNVDKEERANITYFQRDLLVGFRHALNNVSGSELRVLFIFDIERTHEKFFTANYSQRVGNDWKFEMSGNFFIAPQETSLAVGLEAFDHDDSFSIKLTKFF